MKAVSFDRFRVAVFALVAIALTCGIAYGVQGRSADAMDSVSVVVPVKTLGGERRYISCDAVPTTSGYVPVVCDWSRELTVTEARELSDIVVTSRER